jgi:hypothetical protein
MPLAGVEPNVRQGYSSIGTQSPTELCFCLHVTYSLASLETRCVRIFSGTCVQLSYGRPLHVLLFLS